MATATALARARPAKTTCNPTPTSQIIGPEGPKHPGNRQLFDKRGCPDAGAPLCGNHADTKVATFCAALWLTFALPLTQIVETEVLLAQGETALQAIGKSLEEARRAFETSLDWMLETSHQDIDGAFAGSVPFLMMTGTLAAGWKLAQSAAVAQSALKAGKNTAFMTQKIATALFFAQHILPECTTEKSRITSGAQSLLDEAFLE